LRVSLEEEKVFIRRPVGRGPRARKSEGHMNAAVVKKSI